MQYRLILVLLVFLFSSQSVYAVECSAVFPDGLQNNDSQGTITFGNNSQLLNNADNILASNNSIISNGGNLTCGTVDCISSGAQALNIDYIFTSPGGNNESVNSNQVKTLAPGDYGNLDVNFQGTLNLTPGDYTFDGNIKVNSQGTINITGNVRIFISGTFDLVSPSYLNLQNNAHVQIFSQGAMTFNDSSNINAGGEAAKVLLYSESDIALDSNTNIVAYIYSNAEVTLNNTADLIGAISANTVNLGSASKVTFDDTQPEFGDFCQSQQVTPILEYRFDECSYAGLAGDVVDQTGNFPGQPFGDVATQELGQVGRFVDISAATQRIETSLTLPPSYSVSVWFKKPTTSSGERYFVLGSVDDGGDLLYLDRLNDLRWGVYDGNNPSPGTYEFNDLDNNWHHLALVYHANQTSLYIDGVFIETVNAVPAGTLTYIGTSYDDIDGQGFRAPLDEFLLFEQALTAQEIATIYSNQSANNNYDGSTRAVVNCAPRFEAGRITLKDTQGIISSGFDSNSPDLPEGFTQICFDTPFAEPPAVFTMPTRQTSEFTNRLTLRIRNVTETGFQVTQVRSQAANAPNGYAPQTVDFIAVKKGNFQLASNQQLTVGAKDVTQYQTRRRTGTSWLNVPHDLPDVPAVLATMQTMNNEFADGPFPFSQPFMAATVQNVEDDNFQLAIEQGETNTPFSQAETIAYLAITPGAGVLIPASGADPGVTYEAIRTPENIGGLTANYCRNANFTSSFADTPLVVASQNTRIGGDGGWLERCSISSTSVGFNVTEDGTDNDDFHLDEIAGVLALGGNFADYTNSCGPSIHHFEIDTGNAEGLTCEEDTITIKACANASCSIINPDAVDVKLLINNSVYKTVTVSGDSGTTTSYPYTTVGTAALSLDQTYKCTNSTSTPCNVTFADSGFLFSAIPTQISGKPSDQGFNASTLTLQAIETDNNTGACIGAFPDGGDIPVNLSYSCDDGNCSQAVALTNNATTHNVTTTTAPYTLRFGTDSTTTFSINYADAAKLTLNAQKDLEVEDADGNKEIKNLTGQSNAFVERPFGFFIEAKGDTGASVDNGTRPVYKKAGEEFTVELKAVVWQSDDDSGNDGIPDIGAKLSDNAVTDNFGNENTPETAKISYQVVAPSPGAGTLTSSAFVFKNGVASDKKVSFSEVGIISLTANLTDGSYLGASDIQGNLSLVGRFIPAYFKQTVNSNGQLKGEHFNGVCEDENWVYTGQKTVEGTAYVSTTDIKGAIRYSIPPVIDITAYNQNGSITQNYTSAGFMKLNGLTNLNPTAEIIITPPTADDGLPPHSLTASMSLGADPVEKEIIDPNDNTQTIPVKGVVSYTFNDADNYFYNHISSAKVAEFDAKIPFVVSSIKDNDGVMLQTQVSDSTEQVVSEGVAIRFGRWHIENGYGPETSDLNVSMQIQYFDGTDFVTNELESCTLPAQGNRNNDSINSGDMDATYDYRLQKSNNNADENIDASDIEQLLLPLNPGTEPSQFYQGLYRFLSFSAVSSVLVDKRGSLDFEYQVPPWLQYDWNGNSVNGDAFDQNPTATITFGLYRGNDRIIYQREIE